MTQISFRKHMSDDTTTSEARQELASTPCSLSYLAEEVPFRDCHGFDHNCVRCDDMAESDMETKYIGEKGTCCVCVGHGCEDALREREIHPRQNARADSPDDEED